MANSSLTRERLAFLRGERGHMVPPCAQHLRPWGLDSRVTVRQIGAFCGTRVGAEFWHENALKLGSVFHRCEMANRRQQA
jgi:hypothetical protein